jgi:hypothetical protein
MKKWTFILLICLLQFSCFNKDRTKLIPRKELVPLLVDINIADALAVNNQNNNQLGKVDSAIFYGSIFKKHNHSKKELEKTLHYYSSSPKKLTSIYDEVFAELSKRSEEAKTTETKFSSRSNKIIWKSTKAIFVEGDTVSYPKAFDIPVDTLGSYLITANVKMTKIDQSINPRITAYFYDPLKDNVKDRIYFKEMLLAKSDYAREYQLTQELRNHSFSRLHIIIPTYDKQDPGFHKYLQISYLSIARIIVSDQK